MKFRYLLNNTEIREPIGFDGFKPKIERTEHHGIGVSVSLDKVGFTGNAVEIIQNAYENNMDTVLTFVAQIKKNNGEWTNIYSGALDLGTYELQNGDDGCRINCNIGEVGVKTTFNNRYNTEISILRNNSMDDVPLTRYSMLKLPVTFTSKEILKNSKSAQNETVSQTISGNNKLTICKMPTGSLSLAEINTFQPVELAVKILQTENLQEFLNREYVYSDFIFVNESGSNIKVDINARVKINLINVTTAGVILYMYKCGVDNKRIGETIYKHPAAPNDNTWEYTYSNIDVEISLPNIDLNQDEKIFFGLLKVNTPDLTLELTNETFFSITTLTKADLSTHNVSLVHETLSRISEIISGITVKSDWYGRENSNIHPISGFGGGALKAILNGYELRNANLPSGFRPPPMFSFKSLFESLNAIDNIGWGFSEENNILYLRVERWQWFYNNDIIITVSNPNNVKRTLQTNKVYTRLKIGYSTHMDNQEINSIDTFHTTREYSTGLKTIDNAIEQMCKFIADPYAIEVTRRKQFDQDTSNWTYDDNIFIVALAYRRILGNQQAFIIDYGIEDADGSIISPQTTYNSRISPERNAIRWAERFFEVKSDKNTLLFTSGTGNTDAKGKPITVNITGLWNDYLQDSADPNSVTENQTIPRKSPLLKPEILSFDYPFTLEDYYKVLQNPYGIIQVDGENCYIQKITPSLMKGTASFELIPAATQ